MYSRQLISNLFPSLNAFFTSSNVSLSEAVLSIIPQSNWSVSVHVVKEMKVRKVNRRRESLEECVREGVWRRVYWNSILLSE